MDRPPFQLIKKDIKRVYKEYRNNDTIEFEYDRAKSESNKMKHGIDFEEAKALWEDPDLLTVDARSDEETRSAHIGVMRGKCWIAITTDRGGTIRIISVRRARRKEADLYERAQAHPRAGI